MLIVAPTDPKANSYISVEEADEIMESMPNSDVWDAKNEEEKEGLLKMATRQIDTLRFVGHKFFHTPSNYRGVQGLQFPRAGFKGGALGFTGVVDEAGDDYIIDANLIRRVGIDDDSRWIGGAVRFIKGTSMGQIMTISEYDSSNGQITFTSDFETVPDAGDSFHVIEAIPLEVKYAVLEQALYIAKGGGQRQRLQAEGVKSYSIGDLSETFATTGGSGIAISPEAKAYLKPWITRIGRLV